MLATLLSVYILISIFSVIYAARMLSRPGISSEIRIMFIKKHVLYAVCFIIIWSTTLLNAYSQLYTTNKPSPDDLLMMDNGYTKTYVRFPNGVYSQVWVKPGEKNYMELTTIQFISFIANISTGFVMGAIRCMEPYFIFLLKRFFKTLFGQPTANDDGKGDNKINDTVAAFLNSSLNIELVHIILKAITLECTKTEIPTDDWKYFIPLDSDFEEKKVYPINEIEINDAAKWKLFSEPVKGLKIGINVLGFEDRDSDTLIINEDSSVEELAPKIFAILRIREGITNAVIRNSLSPELNRDMVFKAGEGQGKSGSFFFFSHDRRFIIKSMNDEEYKTFQNMFRKYFKHLLANEASLLARIYGIFTVKKEKLMPVHLILMGNTVDLSGKGQGLKYIFDLKGSLVNRESKMMKVHKPSSTLKDINLLNIKQNDNLLKFTARDKKLIMDVIK
uniref:PIPK domain-containing protein n=1 Tax=Euplotes harpa TaxID=151035 RepID=A0A7S3JEQ7_9SPIT|mmetsp:Transcript_31619/g.36094  ORF Transcript_31619/g.36094 Transcript_31619/m.36094 type:complete len:447 (+) Transcript_31619:592-1932(+)